MAKLVVTGGMGFIGSNFITYWLEKHPNDEIINLDALTYAGWRRNTEDSAHLSNYRFVHGSITDTVLLHSLLTDGVDAIVHFAAETHVDRSIESPASFIHTNVWGTHQLLQAARAHQIPKFILISTDEVYGTLGVNGMFTEQSPLMPNSPYSASKASGDLVARSYYETYGYPVIVTRCSNNYGPRQFPEKLIPKIIHQAMNNEPIPIYGDGSHIRDWLYVMDHCAAIEQVMMNGKSGEVYNIGGHNEHTNLEVAQHILQIMGKSDDLIQFVQDRPGHDKRYAIDAAKMEKELGWVPVYTFEQGIHETVRWYMEHPDWWEHKGEGNR
ncbi:dTDP-glucose 4,6-dehydratase [Paenibacillus sp. N1-5-1-14]|uniref:dTDP-glucose 4,6-dehydratase n=1 Tax=Paenibacillus radicibacter TaxID=2972488 RepID=UPI002158C0E5|nr:dTDP-glucose 4,6-dehydratase [Paenibacillus radicibacter]MCR8645201.1 dTDP-glucose 4,6-dehydratase [Paenibacillus radicibacter]